MLRSSSSTKVTGTDLFFLALEGASKHESRNGYVCRIIMTLNGHLSSDLLRSALSAHSLDGFLSGLNWSRKIPFTVPTWKTSARPGSFSIREETKPLQDSDICSSSHVKLSAFHPPAFDIQISHTLENKTVLVLSWHHGVMDARGGDLLLQALGNSVQNHASLFPNTDPGSPGIARLKRARSSIATISQQCKPPMARLIQPSDTKGNYNLSCRMLSFTEAETAKVLSIASDSGALFLSSLFFLAITVRAFDRVMKRRSNVMLPYVIPVGQDNRKRGAKGPIFLNHVNFLFFRIEPELAASIPGLISSLRAQMEEQIRKSVPEEFGVVLNFFRHFPLWFVSHQIADPSGGGIASFYFSYQANSDLTQQEFLGFPISDVVHIPPVAYPPGLSVAFSMYGQRLKLSLSYFEECLKAEELSVFEDSMRTDLGIKPE